MNKSIIKSSFIGLTDITEIEVKYSRPLVNGRKIFGSLIPFDSLWRTGADENTIVFFSGDVLISGQKLEKGKYALFTIPGPQSWTIIFYKDFQSWGVPRSWNNEKIVLMIKAEASSVDRFVESFTIGISQEKTNKGSFELSWEYTSVVFSFDVPEQPDTLPVFSPNAAPVPTDFYTSARFYLFEVNDPDGAYARIKMGLEYSDEKPYFYFHLKALIEEKLGLFAEAVASAKLSREKALQKRNQYYVELNNQFIALYQGDYQ